MPYPTIDLNEKKIILLSGYQRPTGEGGEKDKGISVVAMDKLRKEAERHQDAVAFSFISGKWVAAA